MNKITGVQGKIIGTPTPKSAIDTFILNAEIYPARVQKISFIQR